MPSSASTTTSTATSLATATSECTCTSKNTKSTLSYCTCGTDNEKKFYSDVLSTLINRDIPFLLGGTQAYEVYTGVIRATKDLDIFVKQEDCDHIMSVMRQEGFTTELTFPHWLGKIYKEDYFVDVIFSSGNGVARLDDLWFEHSVPSVAFGLNVRIIPAEEMIWSKAFIMEKERFDGGDINHLIKSVGQKLDWKRIMDRFGSHWRVLYSHLVMFGFVYPEEHSECIPAWIIDQLSDRMKYEQKNNAEKKANVCQGPLVSRAQYLTDLHKWNYTDGRLGYMSEGDIHQWTMAIPDVEEKYDIKIDDIAPGSYA
jgi:hypothetical protein